ncbi:hypothetical protein BHO_0900098 (plasmid) [Borrelia hermsii YBT]|uniref:Uncharacterized protein n=1 Tax=Borrelia hermsii YBT TaxID=1313295 RepID=W5T3M2_BORHE|nr:hypothetical protein BHO_0900098 [Borrelia hermsii YBT]
MLIKGYNLLLLWLFIEVVDYINNSIKVTRHSCIIVLYRRSSNKKP